MIPSDSMTTASHSIPSETLRGTPAESAVRAALGSTQATRPSNGLAPRPRATRLRDLAGDEAGSHLLNFPFALATFLFLGGSSLVACLGAFCTHPWTAVTGLVLMLLGSGLYGCGTGEN